MGIFSVDYMDCGSPMTIRIFVQNLDVNKKFLLTKYVLIKKSALVIMLSFNPAMFYPTCQSANHWVTLETKSIRRLGN